MSEVAQSAVPDARWTVIICVQKHEDPVLAGIKYSDVCSNLKGSQGCFAVEKENIAQARRS